MVEVGRLLTCAGAFDIHGLDFETDAVVWAVLANPYFAIDRSICRPVMTAEAFIRFLSSAGFSEGVSETTVSLAKAFAIGHYVSAHLCRYKQRRNTLVGYLRQLCRMANSVFCQMTILRYVGECHRNEYLKTVFDVLRNPIDECRGLSSELCEALYESYRTHLDFVSKSLCDCEDCADRVPSPLRRVVFPWLRSDRGRGHRRRRTSPTFVSIATGSTCLPDIGHLDAHQIESIRTGLVGDLMQQTIYDAIDDNRLPLCLNTDRLGRGFLERSALILVYNVTFILFLIVQVDRMIRLELQMCHREFLSHVSRLQGCCHQDPVVSRYVRGVSETHRSVYEMPAVMMSFMSFFRDRFRESCLPDLHRGRVAMEHVRMVRFDANPGERSEVRLARWLRRRMLSDHLAFYDVYEDPDLTVLDLDAIFDVNEVLVFKAPMWFAHPCSEVVLDMAGSVFRRRFIARARRERESRRTSGSVSSDLSTSGI
uniref:GP30 protein n=1 Tax=Lemniscomys rat herpesvirus TaxID=3141920 RepID=A0AAU7E237_9VIRU